ncbi:unnamed protein product [Polarella glacialis]|uniref:Uncharacterized protein n=1 Tax=Polarella glacialis TaxID=89957 RepID=A0A813GMR9_POLGL|nr:unnamed protein product [Polarella glacialis]
MDARRSFFWMLASGVLNVYKTAEMTRNMWPEAPNALFKVLYAELNTCIGMFLFWVAVEALAFDRVKVFLEATSSDTEKTIVSNLLSGFCDAQVQLGPDLQVIGEHDRLCRIVMADSLTLHGTSFANYLASPDVSRFQAFIDASSVQVGTETASRTTAAASTAEQQGSQVLKILPRVLHVHMRDFKGRLFDVTLFHTRLKTSEEEYRHIIGICEDTSQPRAEAAPAVAAANTNSDNNNNRNDKNKKSNKNDSNNSNKNKKSNNSSSNSNNNNHSNSSNSNSNLRLSSSNSNSNSNSNLRLRRRNNNNSTNNNDDDDGDNNNNNNTNTNNSSLGQATAIGQQAFLGSQERASSVKSQSSASTSGANQHAGVDGWVLSTSASSRQLDGEELLRLAVLLGLDRQAALLALARESAENGWVDVCQDVLARLLRHHQERQLSPLHSDAGLGNHGLAEAVRILLRSLCARRAALWRPQELITQLSKVEEALTGCVACCEPAAIAGILELATEVRFALGLLLSSDSDSLAPELLQLRQASLQEDGQVTATPSGAEREVGQDEAGGLFRKSFLEIPLLIPGPTATQVSLEYLELSFPGSAKDAAPGSVALTAETLLKVLCSSECGELACSLLLRRPGGFPSTELRQLCKERVLRVLRSGCRSVDHQMAAAFLGCLEPKEAVDLFASSLSYLRAEHHRGERLKLRRLWGGSQGASFRREMAGHRAYRQTFTFQSNESFSKAQFVLAGQGAAPKAGLLSRSTVMAAVGGFVLGIMAMRFASKS